MGCWCGRLGEGVCWGAVGGDGGELEPSGVGGVVGGKGMCLLFLSSVVVRGRLLGGVACGVGMVPCFVGIGTKYVMESGFGEFAD